MTKRIYSRILSFGFAALFAALAATTAIAADKSPVGTWKWTTQTPNGESRESTLEIKKQGDKLVGKLSGRQGGQGTEIDNIKFGEDGKISFTAKSERNGRTFERSFTGKLEGDSIKGETKFTTQNGEERTREWTAKREAAGSAATGVWAGSFTRPDGNKMEYKLDLKQEGDKLTGKSISSNGRETEIKDGTVKGNDVSFKIVRERDGRTFTSNYTGKIEGDTIKGKVEADFGGEKRSFDWEAKKSK